MKSLDEQALRKLLAGKNNPSLITMPETIPAREVARQLSALANSRGGYLVSEVEEAAATVEIILRSARLCSPPVRLEPSEPEVYQLDDKTLVLATVPAVRWQKSADLHQLDGAFWTRRGTATVPLRLEEIAELLRERGVNIWELQPAPARATLDDLDPALIKLYLETRISPRRRPGNELHNLEKVLLSLDCAVESEEGGRLRPTNAGLLVFGYEPQEFLRHTDVLCVAYRDPAGVEGFSDRKILRGPLPDLVRQVEEFFRRHLSRGGRIEGFERREAWEYPLEALREAAVNALVHRDYNREGESIRIFLFPDRIEIHSPGLLLPGLSPERMSAGETISKLRNPVMVNLLRDLPPGYIERMGYGIPMMLQQTRRMGLPVPEFREDDEFVVIFHKTAAVKPAVIAVNGDPREKRLAEALEYVNRQGYITSGQYRQLTGVSENTATHDLELLVERGQLVVEGNTRRRRYLSAS